MNKKQNLILWFPIAWSAGTPSTHYIHPRISTNGWRSFYAERVAPAIEWARAGGFQPRVHFHWPFGADPGEPCSDFDGWIAVQEDDLDPIWEEYIACGLDLRNQGIEIVTYHGSLREDTSMQKARVEDPATFLWRFWRAVRPGMKVGSIGFDAVTWHANPENIILPDSASYHLMAAVRDLIKPHKVYVEATPAKAVPWWFDWNILITNSTYKRRHYPPLNPDWPDVGEYTGEIVRLCRVDADYLGGIKHHWPNRIATYKQIAADGHTMAMPMWWPLHTGQKAKELEG